jgi:mono/diheme cytochrome c family protein
MKRAILFACLLAVIVAGWKSRVSAQAGQAGRTVWDGVYTQAQAARGATPYAQQCARCHGDLLQDIEAAPPLTGTSFTATWEGVQLGELADRMRTSMPQDSPGSLSRQQTADLLAYMFDVGKFPAGSLELPGDAALLGQIVFRSTKP